MASINAVLTAENGDDLYPETYDDYVLDSNGEPLSTRLGDRSEAGGVSGDTAFEKINTLNSQLTSHSWTPISAISGGKYNIVQNAHYTQSYIQRYGHLVLVEAVVTCNTSHSGSTPVFYVPAPMDFTTIHIPKFMETPTSGID